jgi:hypothetical protein
MGLKKESTVRGYPAIPYRPATAREPDGRALSMNLCDCGNQILLSQIFIFPPLLSRSADLKDPKLLAQHHWSLVRSARNTTAQSFPGFGDHSEQLERA